MWHNNIATHLYCNDHMHSLASRLFLVTSFTCSTCYKQQSQLRPGNEASLLTVSISRSYSEWADLRLMLGVELTCWQSWTMGRCAWSNKHQKCWFAGLLQERSWFNKRGAASLASCWEHPWIYDNLHLRLLGDFFPDSNPPCPLRALGRGKRVLCYMYSSWVSSIFCTLHSSLCLSTYSLSS